MHSLFNQSILNLFTSVFKFPNVTSTTFCTSAKSDPKLIHSFPKLNIALTEKADKANQEALAALKEEYNQKALELTKLLLPIVKDKNQIKVLKREMALILPLIHMERTGYTVNKAYLIRCKQALIFEINGIKELNYNEKEAFEPYRKAMAKRMKVV